MKDGVEKLWCEVRIRRLLLAVLFAVCDVFLSSFSSSFTLSTRLPMLSMRWVLILNLNLLHCHKSEQLVSFCVKSSTNLRDEMRRRKKTEKFSRVFGFYSTLIDTFCHHRRLRCHVDCTHTQCRLPRASNNTPRREDVMCTEKKFFSQCSIVFLLSFFLFSFHQRGKVARIFLSPLSFVFWLIHKESKSPHVKLFVFTHFFQSLQLWSQYRKL